MRLGYRVAYRLLQAWTFVRRPSVRGTMVAVLDRSASPPRVLLVRHTYGKQRRWELPGGWIQRDETPRDAARRELLEEVGVDAALDDGLGGVVHGDWDFKRQALCWFACSWPGGRRPYDPVEIAEVGWFSLGALPERLGGGARAVLERVPRDGS